MNARPKKTAALCGVAIIVVFYGIHRYFDERRLRDEKAATAISASVGTAKALWREILYLRNQNDGIGRVDAVNNRKLLPMLDSYSAALSNIRATAQLGLQQNRLSAKDKEIFETVLLPICDVGLEEAGIIREQAQIILEPLKFNGSPEEAMKRWETLEVKLETLDQRASSLDRKTGAPLLH